MIISISGSPGTGKTSVAKILSKKLGANLIEIKKYIGKGIPFSTDEKRKTKVVGIDDVKKAVKKKIKKGINIIDGHYSHSLKSDFVFVLRTNPKELRKRLKKRGWQKSKIDENVMAEMLDITTIEALQKNKNVFEIDTSTKKPESVAKTINDILKKPSVRKKYVPGKIDWAKKYLKELICLNNV